MNARASQHYCLMTGRKPAEIALLSSVFGIEAECLSATTVIRTGQPPCQDSEP